MTTVDEYKQDEYRENTMSRSGGRAQTAPSVFTFLPSNLASLQCQLDISHLLQHAVQAESASSGRRLELIAVDAHFGCDFFAEKKWCGAKMGGADEQLPVKPGYMRKPTIGIGEFVAACPTRRRIR